MQYEAGKFFIHLHNFEYFYNLQRKLRKYIKLTYVHLHQSKCTDTFALAGKDFCDEHMYDATSKDTCCTKEVSLCIHLCNLT